MLAACAGREARLDTAAAIARQGGLQPVTVAGQPFTLAAFIRNPDPAQPVVVYIEGDGLAWVYPVPCRPPIRRRVTLWA